MALCPQRRWRGVRLFSLREPSPHLSTHTHTHTRTRPLPQTFLNVVSCPEGLEALFSAFPRVRVVTGAVDEGLNSAKYIVPGLGDYGDRYFGTSEHQ